MKKFFPTIILIAVIAFAACNNKTRKDLTLEIQSDSSAVVVSSHPITDRLYAELDSAEVYNDSILYGYWFKPHEACYVNIFFHKDDTYEFKYYEVGKDDSIIEKQKKGKFAFDGKMITLESDEGWNDYFIGVIYYKHNGTNFYLTDKEEGLYLVKGSD